jgi:hypothetical protein
MNSIFGDKLEEYEPDNTSPSSTSSQIIEENHRGFRGDQTCPSKINLYDDISTNFSKALNKMSSKTLLIQGPSLYLREKMIGYVYVIL